MGGWLAQTANADCTLIVTTLIFVRLLWFEVEVRGENLLHKQGRRYRLQHIVDRLYYFLVVSIRLGYEVCELGVRFIIAVSRAATDDLNNLGQGAAIADG